MIKLTLKDLKLFVTDIKAVLLTFMLPIILVTLFTIGFGGISGGGKSNPIKLLVSDQDSTEITQNIITKLDSLKELDIEQISLVDAKKAIKEGKRMAVLTFYEGCTDSIENGNDVPMELFYDESREAEIGLLQQALISNLMGMIGQQKIKNNIFKFIDEKNANLSPAILSNIHKQVEEQFFGAQSKGENPVTQGMNLKMTKLFADEEPNWALIQAVAGVSVMMLLFSVAAMGATLLEEKEEGTLKRLLYSPINPLEILFGKLLYTFIIALIQLFVLFVFAWLAFDLEIFSNLPALIILLIATAFACSSFGIFLASICKSRKQVESLSTIIILVMSAIGGSMMPFFLMPPFMKKMAMFSVNHWSIQGMYDIFYRHLPTINIVYKSLILLSIGIVISLIAVNRFKKHILKVE